MSVFLAIIVSACVVLVLIIILIISYHFRKKRKTKKESEHTKMLDSLSESFGVREEQRKSMVVPLEAQLFRDTPRATASRSRQSIIARHEPTVINIPSDGSMPEMMMAGAATTATGDPPPATGIAGLSGAIVAGRKAKKHRKRQAAPADSQQAATSTRRADSSGNKHRRTDSSGSAGRKSRHRRAGSTGSDKRRKVKKPEISLTPKVLKMAIPGGLTDGEDSDVSFTEAQTRGNEEQQAAEKFDREGPASLWFDPPDSSKSKVRWDDDGLPPPQEIRHAGDVAEMRDSIIRMITKGKFNKMGIELARRGLLPVRTGEYLEGYDDKSRAWVHAKVARVKGGLWGYVKAISGKKWKIDLSADTIPADLRRPVDTTDLFHRIPKGGKPHKPGKVQTGPLPPKKVSFASTSSKPVPQAERTAPILSRSDIMDAMKHIMGLYQAKVFTPQQLQELRPVILPVEPGEWLEWRDPDRGLWVPVKVLSATLAEIKVQSGSKQQSVEIMHSTAVDTATMVGISRELRRGIPVNELPPIPETKVYRTFELPPAPTTSTDRPKSDTIDMTGSADPRPQSGTIDMTMGPAYDSEAEEKSSPPYPPGPAVNSPLDSDSEEDGSSEIQVEPPTYDALEQTPAIDEKRNSFEEKRNSLELGLGPPPPVYDELPAPEPTVDEERLSNSSSDSTGVGDQISSDSEAGVNASDSGSSAEAKDTLGALPVMVPAVEVDRLIPTSKASSQASSDRYLSQGDANSPSTQKLSDSDTTVSNQEPSAALPTTATSPPDMEDDAASKHAMFEQKRQQTLLQFEEMDLQKGQRVRLKVRLGSGREAGCEGAIKLVTDENKVKVRWDDRKIQTFPYGAFMMKIEIIMDDDSSSGSSDTGI